MNYVLALLIIIFANCSFADEKLAENELRFTDVITKVIDEGSHDGPMLLYFRNIVLAFNPPMRGGAFGEVFLPVDGTSPTQYKSRVQRYNSLIRPIDQYVGRTADVYCVKTDRKGKQYGNMCTLIGNANYFVKIHPK